MKQIFILVLIFNSIFSICYGQQRVVQGEVKDINGKPVEGATVKVKGQNSAVSADADGKFSISTKPDDILTISAVGADTKDFKINNQLYYKFILNAGSSSLDTVLVTTALGIRRSRNSLPYATQQISGDEVDRTPSTNFVNNLSGKIAGLQITSANTLGGSSNVILRGFKSLTQSNQALFVVDGVPFDNTTQNRGGYDLGNVASDINPDDIESVTVLKGAAASALYGSRAANGVIVITTKKGSRPKKGIGIILSQSVKAGVVDKSTLPVYQTGYGQGYGSSGYSSAYPEQNGFFYYTPAIGSGGQPVNVVQTDWDLVRGAAYNPGLSVYNWDAFAPGDPNYGKATPWTAATHHEATDFFITPITSITSIHIDNGNDKSSIKAGYTNSYDGGLLPNSSIKKNVLNFGASYNITDQLSFGGNINYVNENGLNRSSNDFRAANSVVRDFRQ